MIEPARFRHKSNKREASTPSVLPTPIHTCIPGANPALSTVAAGHIMCPGVWLSPLRLTFAIGSIMAMRVASRH